jgi:hypothetical protein
VRFLGQSQLKEVPVSRKLRQNIESAYLRTTPFYRRFEYDGPLDLHRVNRQTIVDVDHGYLGHLNPKAANTSIAAALGALSAAIEAPLQHRAKASIRRELRRPATLSRSEVMGVPGLTRFVCVRNPYSRTLSAFVSKVVRRGSDRSEGIQSAAIADFRAFAGHLSGGMLTENYHWAPQHWFLMFPLEDYDHVMRFETLHGDFHALQENIFGQGPCGLPPEDPRHATNATDRLKAYFDSQSERAVYAAFREDFELFGYERGEGL